RRAQLGHGHLDRAGVAAQPGAQYLERASLSGPDEIRRRVPGQTGRADQPLLRLRQVIADESVAARLDDLNVTADRDGAGRYQAAGTPRSTGERHAVVRWLAVDVKQGRAAWRGPALDPREHGGIVWPAPRLRHRELERPSAEHEVGPPFGIAERAEPAALGRTEPVGPGRQLVLATREPPGSEFLPRPALPPAPS